MRGRVYIEVDNRQKIGKGIDKAMQIATAKMLATGERYVKNEFTEFAKPPIDTGNLRRSITHRQTTIYSGEVTAGGMEIKGVEWVRKTLKNGKKSKKKTRRSAIVNVDYAQEVEFGNHKIPPRPFMRNGMKRAEPELNDIMTIELKKKL